MVKFKDILIEIMLGIFWMVSGIFLIMIDYPIFIIPIFIVFIYLKIKIKNSKKIKPYVENNFKKLGFELLSERPPKFSETKFEFKIEPTLNNVPISRYKYIRSFSRVFKANNREGKKVELNSIITKKWNGEIDVEILNIKNVY